MPDDERGGKQEPRGQQPIRQEESERRPSVAPGKVTRTARLQRGNAVQRRHEPDTRERDASAANAKGRARSSAELTDDPYMDMAHRGLTALAAQEGSVVQARREDGARDAAPMQREDTGHRDQSSSGSADLAADQEPLLRLVGIAPDALTPEAARRLAAMLQALMTAESALQRPDGADVQVASLQRLGAARFEKHEDQQRGGPYDTLQSLTTQYAMGLDRNALAVELRHDVATSELQAVITWEIDGQVGRVVLRKFVAPLVMDDILVTPLSVFHLFASAQPERDERMAAGRMRELPRVGHDDLDVGETARSENSARESATSEVTAGTNAASEPSAQQAPGTLEQTGALNQWMESSLAQVWAGMTARADALWDDLEARYDELLDVMRREGGVPGEYLAAYMDFQRDFTKGFVAAGYETIEGLVTLAYNASCLLSASQWLRDPASNLQRLDTLSGIASALLTEQGWALLWEEFKRPFVESWQRGDYGEAFGRGAFELVDLLLGGKGMTKAGKAGKLSALGKLRALGKLDEVVTLGKLAMDGLGAWMRQQAQQLGTTLRGWLDELAGKADTRPPPPSRGGRPKTGRVSLKGTAAEIYQQLMSMGSRASFPRYARMLHAHGIASPEDIQKAIERIRRATPDIDIDDLAKKLKDELEPRVLEHLRKLPPEQSYQEMRRLTDDLHPKDKGSLTEGWYQQTHAPDARREIWASKADMGQQGVDLTSANGRRIDLLNNGVITEVKSGTGKLQPRELAQFDDYRKMVEKPVTIQGQTIQALRYVFTSPRGVRKNLDWIRDRLQDKRTMKLELHVFSEAGESRILRSLRDLAGLEQWLGA